MGQLEKKTLFLIQIGPLVFYRRSLQIDGLWQIESVRVGVLQGAIITHIVFFPPI